MLYENKNYIFFWLNMVLFMIICWGENYIAEQRMTSYEEEDQYPGGEEYGSLPKFQQFEGPGTGSYLFFITRV